MTERSTKDRILDAAERLFSDHGFSGTSVRAITQEAGVNLAALNYHFGSKDGLIDAVLSRRIGPLNEERLRLLDEVDTATEGKAPTHEQVLAAFLSPALRLARGSEPGGEEFMRLMGRVHAESREFIRKRLARQFQTVFQRFEAALRNALPEIPTQDLFWGIHFVVGAMAHTMMHSLNVLEELGADRTGPPPLAPPGSNEKTGSEDLDQQVLARLISFGAAGLRAQSARIQRRAAN